MSSYPTDNIADYLTIDLSQCKKNIVKDASAYDNFEKSCKNTFTSTGRFNTQQNNPLIYCPAPNGDVLTPSIDNNGNIYCYKNGEPYCAPKVNSFTTSDNPKNGIGVCKDYCEPITSFYLNGKPKVSVTSKEECDKMCKSNDKCTGYTFYYDQDTGDQTCMMYSLPREDYHKYQPFNFSTLNQSEPITGVTQPVTEKVSPQETETNGFPCKNQFSTYKQTANPASVDQCINNISVIDPSDPSNETQTKLKLIDAVKDLSCQFAACTTEYKRTDGKMHFFHHANTLSGEVSYYLKNGEYKDYLKTLYWISGIIVFWMIVSFFLYKIVGGFGNNSYNIFKAFFGNNTKWEKISFIIPSLLTALATIVPLSIGKFAPALYTMIVCTTILILILAIINIILSVRGFTNWELPGGFQLIFMIIIILVSFVASIYFLYESIKDRDYGSPVESEVPFIKIPKIKNYGYNALMITLAIGLIALLVVVKEIFSGMKTTQLRGTSMNVKSNTKGIGIIASALYGIFGGFNLVLAVFAPFLLLTFALFERIFGSIITKGSNVEGFLQNLIINIGRSINNASSNIRSGRMNEKEYLKIGQEFFGGGASNGWAPFGTTLLNIILGMMTNYNYVLSRSNIQFNINSETSPMPSNIRVLDKDMWSIGSFSKE